jgi:hypothetical protein
VSFYNLKQSFLAGSAPSLGHADAQVSPAKSLSMIAAGIGAENTVYRARMVRQRR